jgi:hypothetical protein
MLHGAHHRPGDTRPTQTAMSPARCCCSRDSMRAGSACGQPASIMPACGLVACAGEPRGADPVSRRGRSGRRARRLVQVRVGRGKLFRVVQQIRRADGSLAAEVTNVGGLLDLKQRRLVPDPAALWRSVARRRRTCRAIAVSATGWLSTPLVRMRLIGETQSCSPPTLNELGKASGGAHGSALPSSPPFPRPLALLGKRRNDSAL